jgi:hypothetical protein
MKYRSVTHEICYGDTVDLKPAYKLCMEPLFKSINMATVRNSEVMRDRNLHLCTELNI